jgi:hypothetical protein
MEASQISPELQAAADRLGVDVHTLLESIAPQQSAAAPAEQPAAASEQATAVAVPTETETEKLQRELAESRQETQNVRKLAQVAEEGRVVGSSGGGVVGAAAIDLPNLGMIEPGIRYEYLNGLITDQQLAEKIGPLLAALLKKHEGGTV